MRQSDRLCQCQEAQPSQTGWMGSLPSKMTPTGAPIGGVAVDLVSRHGSAQLAPNGCEGTLICRQPFIIGSAAFTTVPRQMP